MNGMPRSFAPRPCAGLMPVAIFGIAMFVASACASAAHPAATPTHTPVVERTSISPPVAVQTSIAHTAAATTPTAGEWSIVGFSFITNTEGWLLRQNNLRMQVLHTTDAGDTWQAQYDATDPISAAIQFIDAQHGWVVGESGNAQCHNLDDRSAVASCTGAVLSTDDGGATWQISAPSALPITGVGFINARDGFALAARSCENCAPEPLTILRTTDGGGSWPTSPLGPPGQFVGGQLAAIDAQHAIAFTGEATYATTDAGATWRQSPSPCAQRATWGPASAPARLTMIDRRTGWAICADGAANGMRGSILFQTNNAGATWRMIAQYAAPDGLLAYGVGNFPGGDGQLQFFDALHGWYVTGDRGAFVCSTADGGHAWHCSSTGLPIDEIVDLQFVDPMHGFIADYYGHVAHTTDGGAHWSALHLPN